MTWGRTLSVQIAPEAPVIRDGENEVELKLAFAGHVYRLRDDWRKAGFALFQGPDNYGRAMQCVGWINDPIVQIELERLRDNPAETLPSKAELEKILFDIASSGATAAKDRIAAVGLMLEARGEIKRGSSVNVNNGTINNNVLRVPAKPITAEEEALYEARLEQSQMKLVRDARASR
jgi:hypothetical protein